MGLADILLVMCVLVLSAPSASVESGQLILRHAYPENSTNLSYVELTSLNENTELHSLAVGATFELNGTDIEGELNITDSEDCIVWSDSEWSYETPFLPPCDPHNTAQHIPSWLEPVATLTDCTSAGRSYYDEHNDFQLEIPDGAIALEQRVTIDIGVALYGPFLYPEDLRPVSPVFWACVRDQRNFLFLKPVKVTIPHFLKLENAKDVESLGMTFLKGDHEMTSQQVYEFQRAEGKVIIEPHKRNGVLQTCHFCYLCITSKKSKKSIRKAMFCIYAAIPYTMSPSEPAYVYFFVTFLLATCLESLIPELREHKNKSQDFQFSKDTADPALEIVLSQSLPAGWTVGLQFSKQV